MTDPARVKAHREFYENAESNLEETGKKAIKKYGFLYMPTSMAAGLVLHMIRKMPSDVFKKRGGLDKRRLKRYRRKNENWVIKINGRETTKQS